MIWFMRLLLSIFLENNRITQKLTWFVPFGCCYQFLLETTAWHKTWYDLCRLVVAGHTPRKHPNDKILYDLCHSVVAFHFYCEQPNDTKSNMICVIRLLLFFLGNKCMTQNPIWFVSFDFCYSCELEAIEWHKIQYDLCHLVVAIHFSCEPPNDTKSYMMCVIRLLLSIFLETTAWHKILYDLCHSVVAIPSVLVCVLCLVPGPGAHSGPKANPWVMDSLYTVCSTQCRIV
jgi:hypothetical protein